MCGRFTLTRSASEIAEHFGVSTVPSLEPRYNVAPTQLIPIVRERRTNGERVVEMRHWGLVPHWAKDPSIGARMINARAETAAEKPAFREALKRRRCLVPGDGFYEWQPRPGGKQPHHIALQGELFAFAGLFERWRDEEERVVDTVTVLTTDANEAIAELHDRMPVVVDPGDYAAWLAPGDRDGAALLARLGHEVSTRLSARPVSRRVNDVGNDDPGCLEEPAPEEAPEPDPQGSLF